MQHEKGGETLPFIYISFCVARKKVRQSCSGTQFNRLITFVYMSTIWRGDRCCKGRRLDCFESRRGNQTDHVMKSFHSGHQGLLRVEVLPPSEEGQLATLRDMRLEIKVWLLSVSHKASAVLIHVFQTVLSQHTLQSLYFCLRAR